MKFKYIPGLRPTPMLMYYREPNKEIFNEFNENNNFNLLFDNNNSHYWNHNAYLIMDDEKNILTHVVFNDFIYLVYLLRVINKEVIFEIDDDKYNLIKKDLDQLKDEIILIS